MLILKKNDSAVPFRVRLFCCRRPGLWTDWPLDGPGETSVFHLTSIRGFCKCVIISILSKLLLLLGVSESTQIHPCFCKLLIANGSGKRRMAVGWKICRHNRVFPPHSSPLGHKHTHIFMTFMLHFTVFFITCIV